MKRWVYSGVALLLSAALLLMMFPGSAVAQQSRTRIAYLLAETVNVSGDVTVGDDVSITDDVTVGGALTVTGAVSAADYGAVTADSLDITDDVTIGGYLTSLGAPMAVITATGTITPTAEGVYVIASGGAAATVTIDPDSAADGMRLTFVSIEATAHAVVAPTIGFNAADAAGDTCTWSAAIGNSLEVLYYDGEWYVLNQTNCTMG